YWVGMTKKEEVLVTRRGQTTIPNGIRKLLNIREGTRLKVETKNEKIIFSKIPSIFDLAGKSGLTREEASRLLDAMREVE
ncbi:MAG: AbrB/MazE/SpoVT family DNA-binding domain-containing protein, partial [Nitrososphaerales archaeon]